MIKRILVAVLLTIAMCQSAVAAPISIGDLSSNDDGSTEIITDTLNSLEWLRWDVLADLNYNQTLAEIGSGGAYAGWNIAGIDKAHAFKDALLGQSNNDCTTSDTVSTRCSGGLSSEIGRLLGENYPNKPLHNYAFYLSENSSLREVGFLSILGFDRISTRDLRMNNEWGSFLASDKYSADGVDGVGGPDYAITWMLYRDAPTTSVPEVSATGSLAAITSLLALMAFLWERRRVSAI